MDETSPERASRGGGLTARPRDDRAQCRGADAVDRKSPRYFRDCCGPDAEPSRRIDLESVVDAVIQDALPLSEARQIRVERRFQGSGTVTGDGSQLHQVVANLLSNALKFTAAGGIVTVGLTRTDTDVTVAVERFGRRHQARISPAHLRTVPTAGFHEHPRAWRTRTRADDRPSPRCAARRIPYAPKARAWDTARRLRSLFH